jgi:hypothetical protein
VSRFAACPIALLERDDGRAIARFLYAGNAERALPLSGSVELGDGLAI